MNNNINAESFVKEFLETENIGEWLYNIFKKSSQLTLFGTYLDDDKDMFKAIESSIENYNHCIEENSKKKDEILKYTDIEKARFAKDLNDQSKKDLEEYFDEKKKYVENFKNRLAILDEIEKADNELFSKAVKDLHEDLNDVLANYNDLEVIEQRLKSLTDSSNDQTIEDYLKVLDMNNEIFKQRILNAEHVRDNLKEIKSNLDGLPILESKDE